MLIQEEIKRRFNSGNSVQDLLSCLLFKNIKIRISETILLPVVLHGRETWPLTIREEHRPRVFQNLVLSKCGPKRDEIKEGWRKLHNDKLYNFHSSSNKIRMIWLSMKWAGHVTHM
jgi:hypothetical protein